MSNLMDVSLIIIGVLVVILAILRLRQVSIQSLILGVVGAILGLILGALASVPLSKLPSPYGDVLPLAVTGALTLIMLFAVMGRRNSFLHILPFLELKPAGATETAPDTSAPSVLPEILVDTSVIIDGRIADIAEAGFVPGRLSVPRFVLAELQNIADSDDAMRRGRGRRGLDVLNRLRENKEVTVDIIEEDVSGIREVDAKLVALAQKRSCNVLTTDYNLNRVAQIQGVRVLNVNELSNAIRPVVLPGEALLVRVVQPGKERNQGVGYLADGTMIVVENGDKLIGQEVSTEVTRVFQTVAGKMIFAVPRPGQAPIKSVTRRGEATTSTIAPNESETRPGEADKRETNKDKDPKPRDAGGPRRPRVQRGRRDGKESAEDRIIAASNKPK